MAQFVTIYRDTSNGQFATKRKWRDAKRRGSKRYVRKRYKRKEKEPPPPPPPPEQVYEWVVAFKYTESGRAFDVIVTARTESEALQVAGQFLRDDPQGVNIVRARYAGWERHAVRGPVVDLDIGEAEYRDESTEEE